MAESSLSVTRLVQAVSTIEPGITVIGTDFQGMGISDDSTVIMFFTDADHAIEFVDLCDVRLQVQGTAAVLPCPLIILKVILRQRHQIPRFIEIGLQGDDAGENLHGSNVISPVECPSTLLHHLLDVVLGS